MHRGRGSAPFARNECAQQARAPQLANRLGRKPPRAVDIVRDGAGDMLGDLAGTGAKRHHTSELIRVPGLISDGARGTRTPDLLGAIQALSQLSYSPGRRPRPHGGRLV